ncbi:hypothetical protein GCM10023093_06170 [Nemorincola caseinilytica]|uniref:Uncharacterized protein n=1 Tax=Nemorincola caseinilytica TaxID=2054315 RepID=A0ABP8N9D0_9BACT
MGVHAQSKVVYTSSILGKWHTTKGPQSSLEFDVDKAVYINGNERAVYRYIFMKKDRDDLLLFVDQGTGDSTVYEVYNLSDSYLTIRNMTHGSPLWALEKMK